MYISILFAVFIYTALITFMAIPLTPKILDVLMPLNESRSVIFVFEAEYGIDKEKYYYPILLHSYLSVVITIGIMVNIDTLYIVLTLHGCSLFSAIGYVRNKWLTVQWEDSRQWENILQRVD